MQSEHKPHVNLSPNSQVPRIFFRRRARWQNTHRGHTQQQASVQHRPCTAAAYCELTSRDYPHRDRRAFAASALQPESRRRCPLTSADTARLTTGFSWPGVGHLSTFRRRGGVFGPFRNPGTLALPNHALALVTSAGDRSQTRAEQYCLTEPSRDGAVLPPRNQALLIFTSACCISEFHLDPCKAGSCSRSAAPIQCGVSEQGDKAISLPKYPPPGGGGLPQSVPPISGELDRSGGGGTKGGACPPS